MSFLELLQTKCSVKVLKNSPGTYERSSLIFSKPSVLVQKMMPAATELVLGAIRDKLFGPVVMFGLGGIYVEALKLVGFRLSPLSIEDARDLICQTLPPAILKGTRGKAALNVDSLAHGIGFSRSPAARAAAGGRGGPESNPAL